jgi:YidC/Oxa1 family membrane protein insertase
VWLQKLGGAKNPVTKFSNDIVKEDQLQVQKPISELNSIQTKTRQEEKLTPEGSRPGERSVITNLSFLTSSSQFLYHGLNILSFRFKQLKEQEARRRQQREEEERTAEEAAGRGSQMENNEHDSSSFIRGNGNSPVGAAVIDDASTAAIHDSSALKVVNGDLSGQDQKQDGETNSIVEKSEVSAPTEVCARDELHNNKQK